MILKIIDDKIGHQLGYQHAKTINLETYDNTFLSFHKKYGNDSLNYEFQKNFKKGFLDYRYQNSEFRKKNISKYFDNKNEFFMLYQQENYGSICEELYNKEINNYLYTNHLEENDNSIGKYIKSNTKDIAYIEECKRYIINYKFQKSKTSIILEYISQDSYKGYQINGILDFIVGFALHFILILFLLSIIYPIVSFIYITYIYKGNGIINSKELFEMSKVSHINLDDFSIIPKLKRGFIATLILIISYQILGKYLQILFGLVKYEYYGQYLLQLDEVIYNSNYLILFTIIMLSIFCFVDIHILITKLKI